MTCSTRGASSLFDFLSWSSFSAVTSLHSQRLAQTPRAISYWTPQGMRFRSMTRWTSCECAMMLKFGKDGADALDRIEMDSAAMPNKHRGGLEDRTPVYTGPSEDVALPVEAVLLFALCVKASSISLSLSFLLSLLEKFVLGDSSE